MLLGILTVVDHVIIEVRGAVRLISVASGVGVITKPTKFVSTTNVHIRTGGLLPHVGVTPDTSEIKVGRRERTGVPPGARVIMTTPTVTVVVAVGIGRTSVVCVATTTPVFVLTVTRG